MCLPCFISSLNSTSFDLTPESYFGAARLHRRERREKTSTRGATSGLHRPARCSSGAASSPRPFPVPGFSVEKGRSASWEAIGQVFHGGPHKNLVLFEQDNTLRERERASVFSSSSYSRSPSVSGTRTPDFEFPRMDSSVSLALACPPSNLHQP